MSDIVQCYPGRKTSGKGDNIPKKKETENCKEWLLKEISLIKPRIILLFGSPAARTFFEFFAKRRIKNASVYYCKENTFRFYNADIPVYILPHPSSMVKGKSEIYDSTFGMIKQKLGIICAIA